MFQHLDEHHPDVLTMHGLIPADYHSKLVFRSAVESIRGTYIASSLNRRQGLVANVLEFMKQGAFIADYGLQGTLRRFDFEVVMSLRPKKMAAVEVKGGEGNSINISERPLWASEFIVWCHLDGAIVNQPSHGARAMVFNRVSNEMVKRGKLVDALVFKDARCNTPLRPCPKYASKQPSTHLGVAPDIFLMPQRVPSLEDREPPPHDLSSTQMPIKILQAHGVTPQEYQDHLWQVVVALVTDPAGRTVRETKVFHKGSSLNPEGLPGKDMVHAEQLRLFAVQEPIELDSRLWAGSFNAKESSMHQLAPYVGKLKSGMVRVLIDLYSKPGEVVLDPFCGSGVVPLECVLKGRHAIANDLSPYAYVITRGKLSAPSTKREALLRAEESLQEIERRATSVDPDGAPEWVRIFFHPATFREVLAGFEVLRERQDYFLLACLLGILHHVRPGFLSYPASHLTPYLRPKMYPAEKFPGMYSYRDLRSRLLAKVERAYRRTTFSCLRDQATWKVLQENSVSLPLADGCVDAIISSPPYFGALDYARDNRLRLWFLGVPDWKQLDRALTASEQVYVPQMAQCLREMCRVLSLGGHCVLVLGDVERNGTRKRTADIISELAYDVSERKLATQLIYRDLLPDIRRSRRRTKTTKYESIVVMQKVAQ